MAVACATSSLVIIQRHSPLKKPVNRVLRVAHNHVSVKNTPTLEVRSSFKNKVFEDHSMGIVCYRDENGEITCEGYDEGPRLHSQFSRLAFRNHREVEIIDLLQRCWLQIVDDGELDLDDDGVNLQKDLNCSGSNTHC